MVKMLEKIYRQFKAPCHVANIGDVRSLAIHPASTTHSQLSDDEKVSLRNAWSKTIYWHWHTDDIIADLSKRLIKSK